MTNNIPYVSSVPLFQLKDKWYNHNNIAYNKILLCITPELQTAIDDTNITSKVWYILINKYELTCEEMGQIDLLLIPQLDHRQ